MQPLPRSSSPVFPSTAVAALLLVAVAHFREVGLACPSANDVLQATGASRSRAYELKARLDLLLSQLVASPGRPPAPPAAPAPPQLATKVLGYMFEHPGCASGRHGRRHYSDGFRHFVLTLLQEHQDVELAAFAEATQLPLGTLQEWLRAGSPPPAPPPEEVKPSPHDSLRSAQIQTLLVEWERWQGSFTGFCEHAQLNLRLPFGRKAISEILAVHGLRRPQRRPRRSPDELALRDSFETFFPHAQWVGDGTQVTVSVNGQPFTFNVELDVDAHSGAFVGAAVTPTEDSQAVIDALEDAKGSTKTQPLALLLDNKPSNHTDEVQDAAGQTTIIPATPYRAQNKAHVEGAFGLLKPALGNVSLQGDTPHNLAQNLLRSLVITWARTLNHRQRSDRNGKSRADLLTETPSPEEIEEARRALKALLERQRKARETLAARQDPVVRATISAAYQDLSLQDPKGNLLTATARYPLDAVVDAIALFKARRRAGTLPDGADARYLLGITRNLAEENEGWHIALALWEERSVAGDLLQDHLEQDLDEISSDINDPGLLACTYIDQALRRPSRLERFFWLNATADVIESQPNREHQALFRLAARRIHATHSVPHRQRVETSRFLAAKLRPLR